MSHAMKRFMMSSFILWMASAVGLGAYLYFYGQHNIKYGIDLVGGTYITLQVQEDDVVKNHLNSQVRNFEEVLDQVGIEPENKPVLLQSALVFTFQTEKDAYDAEALFQKEAPKLRYATRDVEMHITLSIH